MCHLQFLVCTSSPSLSALCHFCLIHGSVLKLLDWSFLPTAMEASTCLETASVLSVHAMFTWPAEHIMCWTSVQAWLTVPVCILLPLSEAVFSLGFHGRQCVLWASNVPFVVWSKNMCLLSALCHLVTHQVFHIGGFDGGKRDIHFRIIQCVNFFDVAGTF